MLQEYSIVLWNVSAHGWLYKCLATKESNAKKTFLFTNAINIDSAIIIIDIIMTLKTAVRFLKIFKKIKEKGKQAELSSTYNWLIGDSVFVEPSIY